MPILGGMRRRIISGLPTPDEAMNIEDPLTSRTIHSVQTLRRSLSAAYVQELRASIHEHVYNSPNVADEVARRLLRSGDF